MFVGKRLMPIGTNHKICEGGKESFRSAGATPCVQEGTPRSGWPGSCPGGFSMPPGREPTTALGNLCSAHWPSV